MGGARSQVNKPHKSRFAKSTRNVHKQSQKDKPPRAANSDRNAIKGARAVRIKWQKTLRDQKRTAVLNEKRTLTGPSCPPRTIVLFGLSAAVNLNSLENDLVTLLSDGSGGNLFPTVVSSEHKLRFSVLKAPYGDLVSCMEMVKVADLIAFVASVNSLDGEGTTNYIDSFGDHCLSVFRAIGLPNTTVLIRDLPSDLKSRNELKKDCITSLSAEFPEDCKFHLADTKDDLLKFVRLMKEQRPVIPHWRNQRSFIASSKVDLLRDESDLGNCTLLLSGYVRARNLSVNQLVHISGAGDFQLSKIEILKDPFPINQRKGHNMMDADDANGVQVVQTLAAESSEQEPLLVENVPDPLAGEQTWPTEAEMDEADKNEKQRILKKKSLPRGTSDYQAAWILNDTDDDASESGGDDDNDGMMMDMEQSGIAGKSAKEFESDEDDGSLDLREFDGETENESMMMDGDNMTREQIEDDIRKLKEAHAEDEEYPDEVDTPLDVPARKRFAKYRGLKKTSSWDPKESLPLEYARIFAFENLARTKKHVLAKAKEREAKKEECASVGSYVRLHIKEVPFSVASKICTRANSMPIIACGLYQHESKMSVLHFSIKKHNSYTEPIKSKDELVFHVGFRQFVVRPIYSSDNINSDKQKMERFLHPGRFSIASVYAPISFPPLPLIAMKCTEGGACVVAAIGSLRTVNPDRIILKKFILTGYPQRVSKSKATVRYMFHNPEDVRWFRPVEIYTKFGKRGRVMEPVGTHGAMKCIFSGVIEQNDTELDYGSDLVMVI
ncbi:hypothetical protein V2J09_023941 [Rumex salicifolius]